MSISFDPIIISKWSDGFLLKFLKNLPKECVAAKIGLNPSKDRLLIHILPSEERPGDFDKQIFMGSGNHSVRAMGLLHGLIEEALITLSGKQQNGLMGYAFDHESDQEDEIKLDDIVRKVAICLTGKEYVQSDVY
ncbi:hypothetical protein LCGC14_1192520 [marine sediment metagenome]|uniref:Uncharacterized protein n=1 Tax=marine sediment metagenome TaxID=412755 RepID=A0A0F9M6S3_9ZZZZ